jgi:hypothetical protein
MLTKKAKYALKAMTYLAREYAGIGHVAGVAGDHVDVELWNGLARGGPDVHTNVEAIGCVVPFDRIAGRLDGIEELALFLQRGFEPRGHMSLGHQKRVTRTDGKAIPDSEHLTTQVEEPPRGRVTERTIRAHPSTFTVFETRSTTSSPERPSSRQRLQRQRATRVLASRVAWQTGQRCSQVLAVRIERRRDSGSSVAGMRARAGRPASAMNSLHSEPCGLADNPWTRWTAAWAAS